MRGGILNAIFTIKLRLREVESGDFNMTLNQHGWLIIDGRIYNNLIIIKLRLGEVESGVY